MISSVSCFHCFHCFLERKNEPVHFIPDSARSCRSHDGQTHCKNHFGSGSNALFCSSHSSSRRRGRQRTALQNCTQKSPRHNLVQRISSQFHLDARPR